MGVLQVDLIATLEQIRNPLSKIPFKISRNTRIIAYIDRAVADILAQDLQNAAEKIRLIEYELKTTKPMYYAPIQPYLLNYCQILRRAFREYYGIYIPQRVNPFRLTSRSDYCPQQNPAGFTKMSTQPLQAFSRNPLCENCSFQKKLQAVPAGILSPGPTIIHASNAPTTSGSSLDPCFPNQPTPFAEATVPVDNLPTQSPVTEKNTVAPKTVLNEEPQTQLIKKTGFLPQFPSGVHVTVALINDESLYGEWFYENEGFLAIKLSEDSSLYRRGQIVHLNTAHIISIS